MAEAVAKILDFLKIHTEYALAAFLVSLWSIHWDKCHPYAEVVIFVSAIVLLGRTFVLSGRVFWRAFEKVKFFIRHRRFKKLIKPLSVQAKEILRQYIEGKTQRLHHWDLTTGVFELSGKGIIHRAETFGDLNTHYYVIEKSLWEYIDKHSSLLEP